MCAQWSRYRQYMRMVKKHGGLVLFVGLAMSVMGVSCDGDAAAVFRQTATSSIGAGIKTILDGIVDGVVAAVESAGDSTTSSE